MNQKLKEEKVWKVYMHIVTKELSGYDYDKYYIGITSQRPERRWRNGEAYKNNDYFYNAIKKYGWNNIKHIIVYENLLCEDACKIEKDLIKQFNSKSPYGYNNDNGGICKGKMSEETKSKLSEARIGKYCGTDSCLAKKVNLYDVDGKYIKTYNLLKEIAEYLGVSVGSITQACQNEIQHTIKGYQVRYYDDVKGVSDIDPYIKTSSRYRPVNIYCNNKCIKTFNTIKDAAQFLNTYKAKVKKCADGIIDDINGYKIEYKNIIQ